MVNKLPTSSRRAGPIPLAPERKSEAFHKEETSFQSSNPVDPTVKDIGGSLLPSMLASMLVDNLLTADANGKRLLSSPLLSDDTGLKMWSKITHLPDYYQTRDEIKLLEKYNAEIVRSLRIDDEMGLIVLDLGAGDVRKVLPLLYHLDTLSLPVVYYALDLSLQTLFSAMERLKKRKFKNITCHGLWGTFDTALTFVKTLPPTIPRLFLSLGSSFGNDFHDPAVERLLTWRNEMRDCDRMLLGMDGATDLNEIWQSYHPSNNLFENFMRNGLLASNRVLGADWYKHADWEVEGVLTMEPYIMHRFVFVAKRDVRCEKLGLAIKKGDKIDCYEAFKYGPQTMRAQFSESGLKEIAMWTSDTGRIHQYLLCKDTGEVSTKNANSSLW